MKSSLRLVVLCLLLTSSMPMAVTVDAGVSVDLLTIDRLVPHTSTVPANQGQLVGLFVRERVRSGDDVSRPVVLMIAGATRPFVEAFDVPFSDYSWMAFLADAGFDVFAMDFTGYGLSPRPKMDDPCNAHPNDQTYLIPNPLAAACSPSYPYTLSSIESDWAEMDTVVNYVRQLRGVERISLLGWSRAGPRIGGYTFWHPDKVDRLFLYAPRYNRLDPACLNATGLPPCLPATGLPQPGVPMRVQPVTDFGGWDAEVQCANQFTPAIRDVLTQVGRQFDPLGSTWGAVGVRRSPVQGTLFGWNPTVASQIKAPTLIIAGDLDATTGVVQGRNLYSDLPMDNKVFIHVACASHQLVWENQHAILLSSSKEWLSYGTFDGYANGSFAVDVLGEVQKEP